MTTANSLAATLLPLLEDACSACDGAIGLPWEVHPIASISAADGAVLTTTDPTTAASTRRIVEAVRAFFGDAWRPGDAAVTNDSDSGSAHPTQISTVVPVWSGTAGEGAPDHWAVVRAGIPDFGGWELGGYSPQAIDRWAEGGRIVPVKLRLAGAARREANDTLILNSRTAAITLASVEAMAAAATTLAERFQGLRSFLDDIEGHRAAALAADRAVLATAIDRLKPGPRTGQCAIAVPWDDADAGSIEVAIERRGESLSVTFPEPPAVDPRPINCGAGTSEDIVLAAFAAGFGIEGVHGDALRQAVEIKLPDSRLAAKTPAAIGIGRETTGQALFRAVLAALSVDGGCGVDGDAAWAAYRARRIGDILDPATGKITRDRAAAILAEETARTESAA